MKVAGIVLATACALALQTTLARFVIRGTVAVDLVLVVVVYSALISRPVTGLLTGTFAGLVQDALSTLMLNRRTSSAVRNRTSCRRHLQNQKVL